MKNVNEIRFFFRKGANESKDVISNGQSGLSAILAKVVGMIGPGQDAYDDANQFIPELGASSNSDMDASDASLQGTLSNFSEEAQRDIDRIEQGVVAIFRVNARAREEGFEEGKTEGIALGRAELMAEIEAGNVPGFQAVK